jgi:hypothetical protein
MKKVMVSEHKRQEDGKWKLEEKGEALFHAFGTNYEEFGNGPGNYSTAIIEWPDGTVSNVPVEHVRFLVPNAKSNRLAGDSLQTK